MKITQLDEAQGFTLADLRRHMERTGWRKADSAAYDCMIHDTLRPEAGSFTLRYRILGGWSFPDSEDMEILIRDLAELEGRSPQALLREANPRMRRGLPSEAAWEAHGKEHGYWIACWDLEPEKTGDFRWFSRRPFITQLRMTRDTWDWGIRGVGFYCGPGEREDHWLFWPCDTRGNKLRWPERAGVLL